MEFDPPLTDQFQTYQYSLTYYRRGYKSITVSIDDNAVEEGYIDIVSKYIDVD